MPVRYEKLKIIRDSRGLVFEPLEARYISEKRNSHIVLSEPGVIRGNHYHRKGEETIAVMGPALVRFRDKDKLRDIKVPNNEVYSFVFSPGQSHAIKNLSKDINILMAFNTIEHDPKNPDTEVDVIL